MNLQQEVKPIIFPSIFFPCFCLDECGLKLGCPIDHKVSKSTQMWLDTVCHNPQSFATVHLLSMFAHAQSWIIELSYIQHFPMRTNAIARISYSMSCKGMRTYEEQLTSTHVQGTYQIKQTRLQLQTRKQTEHPRFMKSKNIKHFIARSKKQ